MGQDSLLLWHKKLLKWIPRPPILVHKEVMLQTLYCMGCDAIKTFQMRGIMLNIIQEICGRIKNKIKQTQSFPNSQMNAVHTALSHFSSLTIAFLLLVKSLTFSVFLGCG